MTNPLLENTELPQFSKILPEHVEPAINQLLSDARQTIARQLEAGGPYTWQNLIEPIEAAEDRLNKAWSPVSHMNSVVNSEAMRDAYNACLGKLSEYATETGQNRAYTRLIRPSTTAPTLPNSTVPSKKSSTTPCAIFICPAWTCRPSSKPVIKTSTSNYRN
jgi:oligopeptidase A (EC:3.4.24.70). Metallo peptidase. MEROPS family M03A